MSQPSRVRTGASAMVIALAWLGVLLAAFTAMHRHGAPSSQVVPYLAAWLVGSTFPGVLVWRALAGHSTIVREIGFGSVLGIVLQLMAWGAGTAVHRPRLMVLLPVGVLVLFLAVPALRPHWRPRRSARYRTPVRWHVAMAGVLVLALFRFYWLVTPGRALPPDPSLVRRDSYYNSAISYELSRTLRPQDPFAVGEPLRYHWFADAHVTATAQLSGVPIVNTMITLWLVPILVVLLLAAAAAAQHFVDGPRLTAPDGTLLSDVRRWWVGPVAAFFAFVATPVWRFGSPAIQRLSDGFVTSSPSGILALILILCVGAPILDLLRGRAHRGTWVVATILLAACVGTKPSILPVVAFGAAVVLVLDLVRRRGFNRAMAYVVGASAVLAVVAAPILTGSTGGSHPQLGAIMTLDPSYAKLLDGDPVIPGAGGWLVPALAEGRSGAVPILAMIALLTALSEIPRLLSLAGVVVRPLRTDPGVLWACGLVAGGYAGMWVLAHPGHSEHYFWTDTVTFGTMLTITNATRMLPASRRVATLLLPGALVVVPAIAVGYVAARLGRVDLNGPVGSVVTGRLRPYGLVLLVLAVAVGVAQLLRVLGRRWSMPVLSAVTAFALAACLPAAFNALAVHRSSPLKHLPAVGRSYPFVSAEQSRAAVWLNRHTATTDVVASNMFCWPMGTNRPNCLVNSAWLSGISGRRIVLGDWTYSSKNQEAFDGVHAVNRMSAPWPERQQLSTQAVENPTPAVLGRLRREYGTRWLFADQRATKISPRLAQLAQLRYSSPHIRIYRLADTYAG